MTLSHKRHVVSALLVAMLLWPIAQRALVSAYDVSPWKLFGWAMYTVPKPDRATMMTLSTPEGDRRLIATSLAPEVRDTLRAYHGLWGHVGRLASPEPLACKVFAEHPGATALTLVLSKTGLIDGAVHVTRRDTRLVLEPDMLSCPAPGPRE